MILDTAKMRKIVNVRDLVEHFVACGLEDFSGTIYQDDWGFVHDALSLMTSIETKSG